MDKEKQTAKEIPFDGLFFHHARPLDFSSYGIVTQEKELDSDFEGAYEWVAEQVGFYPLFMAVGDTLSDVQMTGYQNQWRRLPAASSGEESFRTHDNDILFSYKSLPSGIFMDYSSWHIVLNSQYNNYQISNRELASVFKPSYTKSDWLRYARNNPHSVQFVVPSLDLRIADLVSVRNQKTKGQLEDIGFTNVAVRRIPLL